MDVKELIDEKVNYFSHLNIRQQLAWGLIVLGVVLIIVGILIF